MHLLNAFLNWLTYLHKPIITKKKKKKERKRKEKKKKKRGKLHRTANAPCRGRGLWQQ